MSNSSKLYYNLLIKLPSNEVIQTSKLDFKTATVQTLKFDVAYRSNIPYNRLELYWNDNLLTPESLLLNEVIINGEKLPVNKFNINNLILLFMD